MSLRRWPDSLPAPLGRGYRLQLADTARRTEFEVAVRARRITAARRDRPTLWARLTDAEFEALRAWWGDEAWSLAGSSDSLGHWTPTRMTRIAAAAAGPDAVLCDALAETAETGEHRVEVTLAAAGWAQGDLCAATVSLAPVEVVWRRFLAGSAPDGPEYVVGGLTLRSVSATPGRLTATAGWNDLVNERWPRLVYSRDRFPTLEAEA